MATYKSQYTGAQIDEAVGKATGLTANNGEETTEDLSTLKVGDVNYKIPEGVEPIDVVANNGEATTADLATLKVGDVNYKIPEGSGGSGVESIEAFCPIMAPTVVDFNETGLTVVGTGMAGINGERIDIEEGAIILPIGFNADYFQSIPSEDGLSAILDLSESTKAKLNSSSKIKHNINLVFTGDDTVREWAGTLLFELITDETTSQFTNVSQLLASSFEGSNCSGIIVSKVIGAEEYDIHRIPTQVRHTPTANSLYISTVTTDNEAGYLTIDSDKYTMTVADIPSAI